MFRVPSLCPSTTSLPQAPSQQRMTLFATHNKALVDLPRLEKPLKSLSKLIFSGETLVGTHLAVGGSSEARAQLEQLASDLPPPPRGVGHHPVPDLAERPHPLITTHSLQARARIGSPCPGPSQHPPPKTRRPTPQLPRLCEALAGRQPFPPPLPPPRSTRPPCGVQPRLSSSCKVCQAPFPAVFLHTTGPRNHA